MNKRKILVSALFLLAVSGTSAQEGVTLSDTRMDRKEIKVEKALQGVYLSTELLQCISGSVSLNMGYFREDRLAPTFTLRTLAGLCHYVDWMSIGGNLFGQEHINYKETPKKPYYGLNLAVETAPRWYFSHRPRCRNGQRTMLNSGWFIGVPIQVASSILSQPIFSSDKWLPEHVDLGVTLWVQAGFRYAFTPHFLLEGSASYTPFFAFLPLHTSAKWGYGGYVVLHKRYDGSDAVEHLEVELKAAYVF